MGSELEGCRREALFVGREGGSGGFVPEDCQCPQKGHEGPEAP